MIAADGERDRHWMRRALRAARDAGRRGEVPVGAVVTIDDRHVATAANRPVAGHDPSAHAEIRALRAAGRRLGNYRLDGATLYVTLEPCMMCAKMLHRAGITRVLIVEGGYMGANGVDYLRDHGVEVVAVEGPRDPRLATVTGEAVPGEPQEGAAS